jgi:Cdc6-like AAA superfamily ATPase
MNEQLTTADGNQSSFVQLWKNRSAKQLERIKPAPGIRPTEYTSLADFIHHLTPHKPTPGEPIIIAVNGKPGVGKTYTTTYIRNYLNLDREAEKVTC